MNGVASAITARRATHGVTMQKLRMQKDCLAFQTIGKLLSIHNDQNDE